ncbi:hypothetical protein MUP01_11230 [Candidatus Bathyarchaeota archaeon]|nr:hypothetical protein [Candidatus Bathyarchaeota archaeon]
MPVPKFVRELVCVIGLLGSWMAAWLLMLESSSIGHESTRSRPREGIQEHASAQKGVKGILRIDGKFKSHGPQEQRRAFRKRVAVERVFSRLENLAALTQHNLRGLAKITFHSQLCLLALLLTAQAALNTHKHGKTRSMKRFAN